MGRGLAGTLAVLVGASVVSLLQRASDGALLRDATASLLVWSISVAACALLFRQAWASPPRSGAEGRLDPLSVGLATLAGGLVFATYWGGEVGIGGDYRMHRMYAYQLLNGFPVSHEPYPGVPGHYPPLVHTTLALLVHATGLTVHYAMFLLSVAVSVGVAIVAARFGRSLGLGVLGARFLAALLVTWGGAWLFELRAFQLYLPAVQLAMPFLSRNLALLLSLLALDTGLRGARSTALSGATAVALGVLVGLLGLTRPWEFGLGLAALVWLAARQRSRATAGAVGLALLLSSIYWLPLVLDWAVHGIHASREVNRRVDWPTSPFLYLPLLPLLLVAGLDRVRMTPALRSGAVALAALIVLPVASRLIDASGLGARFGLEGGLVKVERVGQLVALAWFSLAAFGLERIGARWGRSVAVAVGVVYGVVGLATTLRVTGYFLDGRIVFPSPRWSRPAQFVSDLAGSPFYLRHLLEDPREVVLAPAALGHLTASRNGVEVVYSHQAAPIWRDAPFAGHSPESRRRAVDGFYESLEAGAVDGRVLDAHTARYFLWNRRSPEALANVSHVGEIGRFDGATWHLLRVAPPAPTPR